MTKQRIFLLKNQMELLILELDVKTVIESVLLPLMKTQNTSQNPMRMESLSKQLPRWIVEDVKL